MGVAIRKKEKNNAQKNNLVLISNFSKKLIVSATKKIKLDSVFPVHSESLTPLTKPLFRKARFKLELKSFAGED